MRALADTNMHGYEHTHTDEQTDLGDEGPLVPLPHRQPHQGVSQLFHLLVVVQPLHLSLQITWKKRGVLTTKIDRN